MNFLSYFSAYGSCLAQKKAGNMKRSRRSGNYLVEGRYLRSLERVTGNWHASTLGALSLTSRAIMMKTQYLCANFTWQFSSF